ncbi:bifunctional serine/threonine-protein kinase/formylglycine-generating enzyme family protein [Candidatus Uabimicrobium amorphum]|uniref:non-specific serine/threonine protein kinase n=1 Tax=Uabimicrobium amorphum TaxID=2596890 RepID=A0A5S9F5N8_UABAM|nr:bifunctional serine/threonine-protein kinase/formylglycine-generating enzyme family protein [Candidatus Uabimicrobium amorphum]BBM85809.1 putative serine/threonine-protein kinase PknB [Candidatus Uabimicrobium amorphum]
MTNDNNAKNQPKESFPTIPNYKIEAEIGRGGMGIVYLGSHEFLKRKAAIKIINDTSSKNENQVQRFLQEASIVAQWKHDNIALVYDMGKNQKGDYYFAMEYLSGETLEELIAQRALSIKRSIDIICDVLRALDYVHNYDPVIIHRDIKPANIMVDEQGCVKLMDFGLAKIEDVGSFTSDSVTLGSPYYMSLEQALSSKTVDARTDIYSTGVVFYEMLTGNVPFKGDSLTSTLLLIARGEYPKPSELNPQIPPELEKICLKAMSLDVETRYQTTAEMLEDLQNFSMPTTRNNSIDTTTGKMASPPPKEENDVKNAETVVDRSVSIDEESVIDMPLPSLSQTQVKRCPQVIENVRKESQKINLPPMEQSVWDVCWKKTYFNFTEEVWVRLPFLKQMEYAQKYQYWYAKKHGLGLTMQENEHATPFVFKLIPPGKFWMGSPKREYRHCDDEILHKVLISDYFWISETPVTQEQWKSIMIYNPSQFKNEKAPVEKVSWNDCKKFFQVLGNKFKLPTEAQWEYACRGGTTAPFNLGFDIKSSKVNFNGHYPYRDSEPQEYREQTISVKTLKNQNSWGCYDFHGSVWEWCNSWYGAYPQKEIINPEGPSSGTKRVLRGGCWDSVAESCRSAKRISSHPHAASSIDGFRIVLNREMNYSIIGDD